MGTATLRPNTVDGYAGDSKWWNGSSYVAPPLATDVGGALDAGMTQIGSVGAYITYGLTTVAMPSGSIVKSLTPSVRGASGFGDTTTRTILYSGGSNIGQFDVHMAPPPPGPYITYLGPTFNVGLTQAQLDALQQQISNPLGVPSTMYLSNVYLDVVYALPPTVSAITPSGAITTTRLPTVGWTFNIGSDGTGGQTYYRVRVFSAAQYGAGGFDPATSASSADSGVIYSSANSWICTTALANGVTYKAYVMAWQTTSGVNQPSPWTAGSAFNIAITVPVPTAVTPAAASTQTTSRPTLGASVAAMTGGSTMRREWQFASDAGFTANLLTVTEPVGNLTATPSAPYAFPALPTRRAQGVWYLKARALDQDSIYGSYSAGQSFTVSHPAITTSRSPSGGATIQYSTTPTVSWAFSDIDTDDYQTKFQVQLWKTSTPGTVLDSGAVVSAATSYQFVAGLDATWKNTELRWKIQVWDQDNVTGGYSIENTFYLRDLPVVTISAPADTAVVTTSAPLVTWSNTFSGGGTQAQWKVDIVRASVIQETSGWVLGTALLYQVQAPVVTVGPTHQVVVTVVDSNGLTGSDTNNFTASYAAPTTPTWLIDATSYAASGYNQINWENATADGNFSSWKVLRRNVGVTAWTLLYETQTVGTRTYRDYLAPSQQPVEYVVVQTGISFGVTVESAYASQQTTGTTALYLLVCPSLESLNMVLYQVNSDSFGDEIESATINLIGRGRRIELGTRFGQSGQLTASLRDVEPSGPTARVQRLALEALRDSGRIVYFRNPFGDVFQVSMPTAQFDRMAGVGLKEYMTLTLTYLEITA